MTGRFLRDESGAVTIDWVALTAGILLLGVALVYGIFNTGVAGLATTINSNLASIDPAIDTGSAPFANDDGAPPVCRDDTCLYDTDNDGYYDSKGSPGSSDTDPIGGEQISPAEAEEEGFAPPT